MTRTGRGVVGILASFDVGQSAYGEAAAGGRDAALFLELAEGFSALADVLQALRAETTGAMDALTAAELALEAGSHSARARLDAFCDGVLIPGPRGERPS